MEFGLFGNHLCFLRSVIGQAFYNRIFHYAARITYILALLDRLPDLSVLVFLFGHLKLLNLAVAAMIAILPRAHFTI